jgi:hypothetical protein
MEESKKYKQQLIESIKELARSINTNSKVVLSQALLNEVTSNIPLSNMEFWEALIRFEYNQAQRSHETPKWKVWPKPSSLLTLVDLASWDGFRREKVLYSLKGQQLNKFFLTICLRRLNDWVPEVRQAARECLPTIIKRSTSNDVVDAIAFTITHWSSWRRINQIDREALLEVMAEGNIALLIKDKLINSPSGSLLMIFSQFGRTQTIDQYLEEISMSAVQPFVRAKAYRCLLEGRITWVKSREWQWTDKAYCIGSYVPVITHRELSVERDFNLTLVKASNDPSSLVRRVAAEILIKEADKLGASAASLADKFARDKSKAVSERGLFALKQLKVIN